MQEELIEIESFIRKSISEEQEAISSYLDRIDRSLEIQEGSQDPEFCKKLDQLMYTLEDIVKEEEMHVGQLREMLKLFDISNEKELEGEQEARELVDESFVAIADRLRKYVKEKYRCNF